jgi:hypothetical protein
VKLALDTITAFSSLPALAITLLAGALAGLSTLFLAVVLVLWATGEVALEGWMWAAMGFLVLWNVQFLSLALLGNYVVRTHRHTQRRPLYVVDTVIESRARPRDLHRPAHEAEEVVRPSALVAQPVD